MTQGTSTRWLTASFAALAVMGLFTSAGMADTYVGQLTLDRGPYQNGVGGEFSAELNPITGPITSGPNQNNVTAPGIPLPIEAQAALVNPSSSLTSPTNAAYFQTFCIEGGNHDVTFNPGSTYSAYLVDQKPLSKTSWLYLNPVTASLFDAFWSGRLVAADLPFGSSYLGYDYSNDGSRNTAAGILQDAIWVSQGDFGPIDTSDEVAAAASAATGEAGIGADLSQQAVDLYDLAMAGQLKTDGNTIDVLNLLDPGGGPAQAQLVEVPPTVGNPSNLVPTAVPLPKSAGVGFVMLGGFGALAVLRKRWHRFVSGAPLSNSIAR